MLMCVSVHSSIHLPQWKVTGALVRAGEVLQVRIMATPGSGRRGPAVGSLTWASHQLFRRAIHVPVRLSGSQPPV